MLVIKSIKVEPELYKKVKAQAALEGKPLHEWIATAFVSKLNGNYNAK